MEIKKKEFKYRGKTLEELKTLDVREFAKLLRSRERRSVLRNFQRMEEFVKRARNKVANKKNVRTHDRTMIVVPQLIGMRIQIYNGNKFVPIDITGEMLGHKLGEFAPTRSRVSHTKAGVGATKGTSAKAKK